MMKASLTTLSRVYGPPPLSATVLRLLDLMPASKPAVTSSKVPPAKPKPVKAKAPPVSQKSSLAVTKATKVGKSVNATLEVDLEPKSTGAALSTLPFPAATLPSAASIASVATHAFVADGAAILAFTKGPQPAKLSSKQNRALEKKKQDDRRLKAAQLRNKTQKVAATLKAARRAARKALPFTVPSPIFKSTSTSIQSLASLSHLVLSDTLSPTPPSRRFQPDMAASEVSAFLDAHRSTSSTGRFLIRHPSVSHTDCRLVVTDGGFRPSRKKRKAVAGIGVVWGVNVDKQISQLIEKRYFTIKTASGCAELLAIYEGIKAVAADEDVRPDSINPPASWSLVVATDYLSLVKWINLPEAQRKSVRGIRMRAGSFGQLRLKLDELVTLHENRGNSIRFLHVSGKVVKVAHDLATKAMLG